MRLKYQLFFTLLLSSLALIALMALFNVWSLNRGFNDYVVENERTRLAPIIEGLQSGYQVEQNWTWLVQDPKAIKALFEQDRTENRGAPQERGRTRRVSKQRITLLDANRDLLVGRSIPTKNVVWDPIQVDDEIIAYLGIREPRGLPGEIEEVFITQQVNSYVYAAMAMAFLSGLLAIGLASRIVTPILKVNSAVKQITGGEYEHSIPTARRDEIGDLSRNINQMAHTLSQNQTARQQWMAEISHELRTPVAILRGELESIQDGIKTLDASAIDSLHAESVRLGRLIDDLHELTLSDIGALTYKMVPTDLSLVFNKRLKASATLTENANLTITVHGTEHPNYMNGDAQRLAQLIDNLMQNSVRYTDDGGQIDLVLSQTATELVLNWSDSAPGVYDEQLPRLFDSLYRAEESRNRDHGGSGLGLAIVKNIVTAHQGSIRAYHSGLGGLGIEIRFPLGSMPS